MSLPLQELAQSNTTNSIVRLTDIGLEIVEETAEKRTSLLPPRPLRTGEQYRFHFDMTKCIGCRSCEVACNEQNGNPASLRWRRIGEIEGGSWPNTDRYYLSMGCNHCLSPDCLKGCPVNAYTKDPVTGIVLHSAEACIGCQYCVWNCPYSVPQFNPERGVVGKCDMCHGRLTQGFEPACVNACPENAIEIEIVDQLEWRSDYAAANSPGMPSAGQTISTTRITLPEGASTNLERVDVATPRQEHAHWSLVWMTSLIQLSVGSLVIVLLTHVADPAVLLLLLGITALTLNISIFHLGRPVYAWRALKMWRRSWLSREVLLFGFFFGALSLLTTVRWLEELLLVNLSPPVMISLFIFVSLFGIAGLVASAYIYRVPARPAWNTIHTPIDFLLSACLLGIAAVPVLSQAAEVFNRFLHTNSSRDSLNAFISLPLIVISIFWIINQAVRTVRLSRSHVYECRASASLLNTDELRGTFLVSFALIGTSVLLSIAGYPKCALPAAFAGVLSSRYIFFVSVVPLNMALTFVRSVHT